MKTTIVLSTLLAAAIAAPAQHAFSKRQGQNFQTFTGALGGIAATPITDSGNPDRQFQVKGDTFVNIGAAVQRSCDQQFNACANAANGGDATLSVSACADQKTQCDAAGQSITGASNGQDAANSTSGGGAAAGNAAAAVPCDQASPATSTPSATATAAPAAASSATAAAKDPCDTAAAGAKSNGGNAKQGQAKANGKDGKNKNGAAAAADPCDKKRRAMNKRSIAAKRITRRYRVA